MVDLGNLELLTIFPYYYILSFLKRRKNEQNQYEKGDDFSFIVMGYV
jgi:hypothetical protein